VVLPHSAGRAESWRVPGGDEEGTSSRPRPTCAATFTPSAVALRWVNGPGPAWTLPRPTARWKVPEGNSCPASAAPGGAVPGCP